MAYNAERSKQFNLTLDRFVEEYQEDMGYSGATGYLMGMLMTMFHDLQQQDQETWIRSVKVRLDEVRV